MKLLQSLTPAERKRQEREALLHIYRPDLFNLKESLRPDFEAIHKSSLLAFGVEHTELYFSDASARIKNNPAYVEAILNKGHYVKPGDKKQLNIIGLQLFTLEGEFIANLKGITVPDPGTRGFQEKFKERLTDKIRKYPSYNNPLDVVVHDREGYLIKAEKKDAGQLFFSDLELCTLLTQTHIREVFYLGEHQRETVFIPLRASLFLTHVGLFHYFYHSALKDKYPERSNYLHLLFSVLSNLGYKDVQFQCDQQEQMLVVRNNTLVKIFNPECVRLIIYHNEPLSDLCHYTKLKKDFDQYNFIFPTFLAFSSRRVIHSDHFILSSVKDGKGGFYL